MFKHNFICSITFCIHDILHLFSVGTEQHLLFNCVICMIYANCAEIVPFDREKCQGVINNIRAKPEVALILTKVRVR